MIFVVFVRTSIADIARRIDTFCAFDDQVQNVESYRSAGAVQVDRRFRKDDVLEFIGRRWNEAAVESSRQSRYDGKSELCRCPARR